MSKGLDHETDRLLEKVSQRLNALRTDARNLLDGVAKRLAALKSLGVDSAALDAQLAFARDLCNRERYRDAVQLGEEMLSLAGRMARNQVRDPPPVQDHDQPTVSTCVRRPAVPVPMDVETPDPEERPEGDPCPSAADDFGPVTALIHDSRHQASASVPALSASQAGNRQALQRRDAPAEGEIRRLVGEELRAQLAAVAAVTGAAAVAPAVIADGRECLRRELRFILPDLLYEPGLRQQLFAVLALETTERKSEPAEIADLRRFISAEIRRVHATSAAAC